MKMIVGLGNIGPQYDGTRHNAGFSVIDALADEYHVTIDGNKMEAQLGTSFINNEKVMFVKPTTLMNDSGRAIHKLMEFYKLDLDDLIVIYDDMDLPVGKIRLRNHGSAGGHNGIKSTINYLGTNQFNRVRMGTSHPQFMSVIRHVLGKFTKEQKKEFNQASEKAVSALDDWINGLDFKKLENKYN